MTRGGEHSSDDPGRQRAAHHPSSGESKPSPPRRPGAGARQAARHYYAGEQAEIDEPLVPGAVFYDEQPVVINQGKPVTRLRVVNTADRPVQVGSHFHFAEVNSALEFDREVAWGLRLNVVSGGAMRFEPGVAEQVELVPIGGRRIVAGLRGLCGGNLDG